jgi:hypothetical protein
MAPFALRLPVLRPKSQEDCIECSATEHDDFDGQSPVVTADEPEQLEAADEGMRREDSAMASLDANFTTSKAQVNGPACRIRPPHP